MTNPLPSALRPNANLTNLSVAFTQDKNFDAYRLPGIVPVKKRSDRYLIWDRGDWLRDSMQRRVAGQEAAEIEHRVSNDTYFCERWAGKKKLTDEDFDDYPSEQEADEVNVAFLDEQSFLNLAVQFGSAVMGTSIWFNDQTGVAAGPGANQFLQWNNAASTPIADFLSARRRIRRQIGRYPTVAYLGGNVFDTLCQHSTILDAIKHTQTGVVTEAILAGLFKVDRVIVLDATRNTAAEGLTATMADIVGNVALLGYVTGQSMRVPSALKIMAYQRFGQFPAETPLIDKYFEKKLKSWWYEVETNFDVKVTSNVAGQFFASAVA